jgi:hypothetical protein
MSIAAKRGLSKEEVLAAIGPPTCVLASTDEQWVYAIDIDVEITIVFDPEGKRCGLRSTGIRWFTSKLFGTDRR